MNYNTRFTLEQIRKIDKKLLVRPHIKGDWPRRMNQYLDHIYNILNSIDPMSNNWSQKQSNLESFLNDIHRELTIISELSDDRIKEISSEIYANIDAYLAGIAPHLPEVLLPSLLKQSIPNISDYEKILNEVKTTAENLQNDTLKDLKEESQKITDSAKSTAEKIVKRARKTSREISVSEAQDQFLEATKYYESKIKLWRNITVCALVVFLIMLVVLVFSVNEDDTWTWHLGYTLILRIAGLGLISTILSFSLKMLKANMHMKEHSEHRKRIANSMISFSESAISDEQRDLILTKLVEAVSDFGTSGILTKSPDNKSAVSIDSITKTVSSLNGK